MKKKTHLKLLHKSAQSGQAIVIIALAMVVIIGVIIIAIDGGRYLDQRRRAQNAADMASLGGLYQVEHGGTYSNDYYVVAQVNHTAEVNSIPDTDSISDPGSTAFSGPPAYSGDATNGNVKAYWIDSNGDYVNASSGAVTAGSGKLEPPDPNALIPNDPAKTKPSAAKGILVRVKLQYTTFIGMSGVGANYAQADGVALVRPGPSFNPPDNCGGICAISAGGGNCTTALDPAFYWGGTHGGNTNGSDWGPGVFINGYLRIDNMPDTVTAHGGTGRIIAVDTSQTQYASGGSGTQWPGHPTSDVPTLPTSAGGDPIDTTYASLGYAYNYYGSGSVRAVRGHDPFPDWAYLAANKLGTNIPPTRVQIQAPIFRPNQADIMNGDIVDTPANPGHFDSTNTWVNDAIISGSANAVPNVANGTSSSLKNWIFKSHELNITTSDPTAPQLGFFHYINEQTAGATDAAKNGDDFVKMFKDHGEKGIFFIDGDLDAAVDMANTDITGVTIIATGKVRFSGGHTHFWSATVTTTTGGVTTYTGLTAMNISILAGGSYQSGITTIDRSGKAPTDVAKACAGENGDQMTHYILNFQGNQTGWKGIIYVPNGEFMLADSGPTDFHHSLDPNGPLVVWSQATAPDGSGPVNNYQFSRCDASCFPVPTFKMGLQAGGG